MNEMLSSKILKSFLSIALVLGCTTLGQVELNVGQAFADDGSGVAPAALTETEIETFTQDTTKVTIRQSTDESGAVVDTWAYLEPTEGDTGEIKSLSSWNTSTNIKSIQRVETKAPTEGKTSTIILSGTAMESMFQDFTELKTVEGLKYWDISAVTSLKQLFNRCTALSDISPLSNWSTSNVTSLQRLLYNCSSLTDISALATWDTGKVYMMNYMLNGCSGITTLNALKNWNTEALKYVSSTFRECTSLSDISGLSAWKTANVENTSYAFRECGAITDFSALKNWDMTKVTSFMSMFGNSSSSKPQSNVTKIGVPTGCSMFFSYFPGTAITPEYYGDAYKYKTADGDLLTTDEASADYANLAGQVLEIVDTSVPTGVTKISTGSTSITKPTASEIVAKYKSITSYSEKRYETDASVTSPYATGSLPTETLSNAEQWINFMRYAANLPSISLTNDLNVSAQYAAVLMAANNSLTHSPTQPSDMDSTFFGQGAYAAKSSNIAMSSSTPLSYFDSMKISSLARAIQGWMDDDDTTNISMVGHRRWILNPSTTTMGIGSADTTKDDFGYSYTALRTLNGADGTGYAQVDTTGSVDYEAIAWPASGDFPNSVFFTDTPWSITFNPNKWQTPDASSIEVTLKDNASSKTWTFKQGTTDGDFYVNTQGAGVANAIIFRPSNIDSTLLTGTWEVTISGLKKTGETDPTTVTYNVNFVDQSDLSSSTVTLEAFEATYSGVAKTPGATVVMGTKLLEENKDYTVSYADNKNAGTATVTIEGMGEYSGSITKTFTIEKAPLNIAYKGETITYGDTPRFDLEYTGFVRSETASNLAQRASVASYDTNAGTQTLTPSGASSDNYDITYTAGQLIISKRDISTVDIGDISRQAYTGSAITPEVALSLNGSVLKIGEDYTIVYNNNVNVGTASVSITGVGNFTGSASKEFQIYDDSSPSATVDTITGDGTVKINGKEIKAGDVISIEPGEDLTISWQPKKVGSRNLTLIKSIKVGGIDQSATSKIDKTKWQSANTAYRRLMNDKSAMMTTYDKVASAEQTITVSNLNASESVSVEIEFGEYVPVYRLYNMITSEHLFTTNKTEYDTFVQKCETGEDVWIGEGIDWFAEVTPAVADTNTVRRFYNAALGAMGRSSHYYSKDATEIATLLQNGWVDDGEANYIQSGGVVPIWTCYNEGLGSAHHYTSNKTEWEGLAVHGWALETDKNLTTGVFQAVMSAKP